MFYQQELLTKAALNRNPLSAYLVSAPFIKSANSAAQEFILQLFCEYRTGCEHCSGCVRLLNGSHLDYMHITTDTNSIKIEQVRPITAFLSERSYEDAIKCVYISSAHKLTEAAQNALLKNLEEPAGKAVFVLTTDKKDMLLPTIRSRCTSIFAAPQDMDYVASKCGPLPARLSDGYIERAQEIDEDFLNKRQKALEACKKMLKAKGKPVITLTEEIAACDTLEFFMSYIYDILCYKYTGTVSVNIDETEEIQRFAQAFSDKTLCDILQILLDTCVKKGICPNSNDKLMLISMLFTILEVKNNDNSYRSQI